MPPSNHPFSYTNNFAQNGVKSTKKKPPKSGKQKSRSPFAWMDYDTLRHGVGTGEPDIIKLIESGCMTETALLRKLNAISPVFSTAVFNLVEIATEDFQTVAFKPNGHVDTVATEIAKRYIRRLSVAKDVAGFSSKVSTSAQTVTMIQEVILTGSTVVEAVVKDFQIDRLVNIPEETITMRVDDHGHVFPEQDGIDLNYGNIFRASMHQQACSLKSTSMLLPAVGMTSSFTNFIKAMNVSLDKTGHSRMVVTLNKEMYIKNQPKDCRNDDKKRNQYLEDNRRAVAEVLSTLKPDQCLVLFDDSKAELLTANMSKSDYSSLLQTMAGILALSLKSHPSILGLRLGGSQSLSNIEALTYLHLAKGIQRPVSSMWEQILTLQVRLAGLRSHVKVNFDPINLRPENELESHLQTKQTRLLELLSLGIITDTDFFARMRLEHPGPSYKNLSGTMFMEATKGNNGNTPDPKGPQDGAAEQILKPSGKRNDVKK